MSNDTNVIATFAVSDRARINGVGYGSLAEAYDAAPVDGITTILSLGILLKENLDINKQLIVIGGYNAGYTNRFGDMTMLNGVLTIGRGKLIVDGLTVR